MTGTISRRNVLRTASLGAAGAAVAWPAGTATAATPAPAVDDFLDSLGVCTHIGQGVDDAAGTAQALRYLGIRNLRDDANPDHVADWISVHEKSGARTDLLTDHDLPGTLEMARALRSAGALMAVEGPNEPNNWPVTYEGKTSGRDTTFLPVAHFQRDLYAAVKADRALRRVPVFASSEAGGSEPDNVGLQFLTVPPGAGTLVPAGTRYADYANTHTYPQGHTNNWVDDIAWNAADPTLNGDWDGLWVEYGHTWHSGFAGYGPAELIGLPRVMTEAGWPTEGDGSITEDQQARLHLAIYLANFARGWRTTFLYMLRDDPVQGIWGLVDQDYRPKASGRAVHNLTAILSRPGRGGSLRPSIPGRSSTVHDLTLRGRRGTDVVVWNEQKIGAANVLVDLGRTVGSIEVYDPLGGSEPVHRLRNVRTVELTLEGYAVAVLKA